MGGTPAQLDALVASGFLEPYCRLLESTDLRAVVVVLDGITNLLQVRCAAMFRVPYLKEQDPFTKTKLSVRLSSGCTIPNEP